MSAKWTIKDVFVTRKNSEKDGVNLVLEEFLGV